MTDHGNIHGESSKFQIPDLSAIDDEPSGFSTVGLENVLITFGWMTDKRKGDPLDPVMIELKTLLNPVYYADQEGCFPGTRDKIIQTVISRPLEDGIRWICGPAGSGKSALAISIVRELRRRNCVVTFFHFDRNDAAKGDPRSVIRTIAYQLALFLPRYRSILSSALRDHPVVTNSTYEDDLDSLLAGPLSTDGAVDPSTPIILVFDALDEFEPSIASRRGTSERNALLLGLYSSWVPVYRIVLSRPTERLTSIFKLNAPSVHDIDLASSGNSVDVSMYFKTRMERIRPQEQSTWPGDINIQKLTEMSCESFTWASAASDFIQSSMDKFENPVGWNFGEINKAMDPFYTKVLESAGDYNIPQFVTIFRVVMGIILGARRRLQRSTIEAMMMTQKRGSFMPATTIVKQLEPLLDDYPGIRIMHPSLSSFFFDLSRCRREDWYFEHSELNHILAIRCLKYLLSSINASVSEHSSSVVQRLRNRNDILSYSCEYWVDHCCASGAKSTTLRPLVEDFLQTRFLQWLQEMGLLKKSYVCIQMLQKLDTWMSVCLLLKQFGQNSDLFQDPQTSENGRLSTLIFHVLNFAKRHAIFVNDHPDDM